MEYHGTEVMLIRDTPNIFGDGSHEATQVVLEALYRQELRGKKVLDIGTGTGIQSIFAKKWGAGEVLAVDIDLGAITTARRNFQKNNVEVTSRLNIYNELLDFKAEVTIANLPPHGVVEFVQIAKDTMADDGVLIFSWARNFYIHDVDLTGYEIAEKIDGIEWDAYVVRRIK